MARAQAVGSPVLMLTVDLAVVGARHRDTRNAMVGQPRRVGEGAPGLRPRLAPELDQGGRARRQAADLRQPREGGAGRQLPGRLQGLGRRAVRPERDLGRHRLGARELERPARGQGRARRRGRPPGRGRRRRRRGRVEPRRPPARRGAVHRTRAARTSSTPSATRSRCSPTAACAPGSTSSRWSRWVRARCSSDGRGPGPSPRAARPGVQPRARGDEGRHRHGARASPARRRSPTWTGRRSTAAACPPSGCSFGQARPAALLRASTCSASLRLASSTISPSSSTAPLPVDSAAASASSTAVARSTSSGVGEKTSLSGSSCDGCSAHLPSKPSARARAGLDAQPLDVLDLRGAGRRSPGGPPRARRRAPSRAPSASGRRGTARRRGAPERRRQVGVAR